jgi:hypothetical protein
VSGDEDLREEPTRLAQGCYEPDEKVRGRHLAHKPGEYQWGIDEAASEVEDGAVENVEGKAAPHFAFRSSNRHKLALPPAQGNDLSQDTHSDLTGRPGGDVESNAGVNALVDDPLLVANSTVLIATPHSTRGDWFRNPTLKHVLLARKRWVLKLREKD